MKLIAFCEAPGDFRTVSGLVDRVLREVGPAWVLDNLDTPEVVRAWQTDGFGRDHVDVHHLNARCPHQQRPRPRGALLD